MRHTALQRRLCSAVQPLDVFAQACIAKQAARWDDRRPASRVTHFTPNNAQWHVMGSVQKQRPSPVRCCFRKLCNSGSSALRAFVLNIPLCIGQVTTHCDYTVRRSITHKVTLWSPFAQCQGKASMPVVCTLTMRNEGR